MFIHAQDDYSGIAKKLNMVNVWDERSFHELSEDDRLNRLSFSDSGIIGNYSMDLGGYLLCLTHFENAARAADFAYGNAKIFLLDAKLPPNGEQVLDIMYMEKAYRDGDASMHIVREYYIGANEKIRLSFVCNEKERIFQIKKKS